jgi:hypothetical protein
MHPTRLKALLIRAGSGVPLVTKYSSRYRAPPYMASPLDEFMACLIQLNSLSNQVALVSDNARIANHVIAHNAYRQPARPSRWAAETKTKKAPSREISPKKPSRRYNEGSIEFVAPKKPPRRISIHFFAPKKPSRRYNEGSIELPAPKKPSRRISIKFFAPKKPSRRYNEGSIEFLAPKLPSRQNSTESQQSYMEYQPALPPAKAAKAA